MKEYRVEVAAFVFISIDSLHIQQQANEHSKAIICGKISGDHEEEYLSKTSKEFWTRIYAVDGEGREQVIFNGLVTDSSVAKRENEIFLTIVLVSGTVLMDRNHHLRTFQNLNVTYEQIFEQLTKGYNKSKVTYNLVNNGKIGEFILQYRETDWQFLKRIAGRVGGYLISRNTVDGTQYYVGMPKCSGKHLNSFISYSNKRRTGALRTAQGGIQTQSRVQYEVISRELHQIGEDLLFQGQDLFVAAVDSVYQKGELIHTYTLASQGNLLMNVWWNENIAGCSLGGRVTKVSGDKVQVKVDGDENQNQQSDKYGKEVLFTPDSIVLTNNKGMSISLQDGHGINVVSDKDVNISAGSNVTLAVAGSGGEFRIQ